MLSLGRVAAYRQQGTPLLRAVQVQVQVQAQQVQLHQGGARCVRRWLTYDPRPGGRQRSDGTALVQGGTILARRC